jgi:multiple sugar transport system permease protein
MTAQPAQSPKRATTFAEWLDALAPSVFIWPSVLIILLLAIFPLFVSLYLSFAQVNLVSGGYEVKFVGWKNYEKIFQGSQQRNFFGRWSDELNFFGVAWRA